MRLLASVLGVLIAYVSGCVDRECIDSMCLRVY